jgi:hypothetical protein
LGVVGEVFEVMAQVDRRLTEVNSVDWIVRVKRTRPKTWGVTIVREEKRI